ncbi:AmpG family muropeptide MFS transporter [Chroococcidiopsis sp. CCNUC1]|nr:AmpG family muropeptide MFS transporter [Chroococcidiopsis sp. CCNUC1]URD53275.1 AmpG family muropeptide MFS transporter [Chroococcidiopsis sp. CCNUC1]
MTAMRSLLQVFQSRKMAALLLLGFASGLPLFLTSRTLQIWMKESNIDLGVIGWFSLVALPYSLKFLWSPVLDRFVPPFLGRRRGWLAITQIGLIVAIAALAFQQPTQDVRVLNLLAITALIVSFFSATQDIVGDAYRTDVLKPQELETGASVWVLGYRMALLVTSFLALVLADYLPWQVVYLLMAALMGVGLFTTFWSPQPENDILEERSPPTVKDIVFLIGGIGLIAGLLLAVGTGYLPLPIFYWIIAALIVVWLAASFVLPTKTREIATERSPQTLQEAIYLPFQEFFQRQGIGAGILILLFILLYKLGDALVGNMANPFLVDLGFSKSAIGAIQGGMGFLATTVGVLIGGVILTKIGINRALWGFGILQLMSNLGYYILAIAGKNSSLLVIAINIENFCAGLVTVVTVAYLMSLCDRRFTTTQFALFSSLMAMSRDILAGPAGEIAKATGWATFFLLTIIAAIPGLLLLPIVAPWNSKYILPRPGLDEEDWQQL